MNEEWFGPWCVVAPLFVSRPAASCPLQEEKTQKPSWKKPGGEKPEKVTPRPDPTYCPFIITLKEKCSSSCVGWCVADALFRQTRSHVYKPGTKSLPKEQSI